MRDSALHSSLRWLIAVGLLTGDYMMFGSISPRMPRLMLIVIGCGLSWVSAGFWIRQHVGIAGHVACAIGVAVVATFMFRGIATSALDLNVEVGTAVLFGFLVFPFVACGVVLHRAPIPTERASVQREFPMALAVFGIMLAVGGFVTMVVLVLGIPRIP